MQVVKTDSYSRERQIQAACPKIAQTLHAITDFMLWLHVK